MEKEIIEYIRKNNGMLVKVGENKKGKFIFEKRNMGPKIGVLWCGINPADNEKVMIGFSLCNKIDRFNYKPDGNRLKKYPAYGIVLARKKACYVNNHADCFIQATQTENSDYLIVNPDPNKIVEIPPSIVKKLTSFVERCKRYYKDKQFPTWVKKFEAKDYII